MPPIKKPRFSRKIPRNPLIVTGVDPIRPKLSQGGSVLAICVALPYKVQRWTKSDLAEAEAE